MTPFLVRFAVGLLLVSIVLAAAWFGRCKPDPEAAAREHGDHPWAS